MTGGALTVLIRLAISVLIGLIIWLVCRPLVLSATSLKRSGIHWSIQDFPLPAAKMENMTHEHKLPIKHQAYRTFVRPYARFFMLAMGIFVVWFFTGGSQSHTFVSVAEVFVVTVTGLAIGAVVVLG